MGRQTSHDTQIGHASVMNVAVETSILQLATQC